jgi:pyrophosphate--fructose-6-phosphate 1-phosphotransferase
LHYRQGTTVKVEYGGAAIAADSGDSHVISHAFPHTYGQPLAHFLPKTANVPDAAVVTEHPVVRYTSSRYDFLRG